MLQSRMPPSSCELSTRNCSGQNLVRNQIICAALVLLGQKVHREMNALQFPARDRKVARMLSAAREQNRIVVLAQLFTWNRMAYVDVGSKLDTFGGHLFDAA